MSCSRQALRELSKARRRPEVVALGQFDKNTIAELLSFYDGHKEDNILGYALENRSERGLDVENKAYLSERYAQIEIQQLRQGGNPACRQDFIRDMNPPLMESVSRHVGRCYRSRISTLQPGGTIPRHMDDPTQLRVISVLRGGHTFTLYGKEGARSVPMSVGELWFVNTAWEHMVENNESVDRVALLLNLFELPGIA